MENIYEIRTKQPLGLSLNDLSSLLKNNVYAFAVIRHSDRCYQFSANSPVLPGFLHQMVYLSTADHDRIEGVLSPMPLRPIPMPEDKPKPDTSASFARQDREDGWAWAERLAEIVWQFWWEHKLTPEQEKAYLDYRKAKEAR